MLAFAPARLPIAVVYASRRNLLLRVRAVFDFLIDAVMGLNLRLAAVGKKFSAVDEARIVGGEEQRRP